MAAFCVRRGSLLQRAQSTRKPPVRRFIVTCVKRRALRKRLKKREAPLKRPTDTLHSQALKHTRSPPPTLSADVREAPGAARGDGDAALRDAHEHRREGLRELPGHRTSRRGGCGGEENETADQSANLAEGYRDLQPIQAGIPWEAYPSIKHLSLHIFCATNLNLIECHEIL